MKSKVKNSHMTKCLNMNRFDSSNKYTTEAHRLYGMYYSEEFSTANNPYTIFADYKDETYIVGIVTKKDGYNAYKGSVGGDYYDVHNTTNIARIDKDSLSITVLNHKLPDWTYPLCACEYNDKLYAICIYAPIGDSIVYRISSSIQKYQTYSYDGEIWTHENDFTLTTGLEYKVAKLTVHNNELFMAVEGNRIFKYNNNTKKWANYSVPEHMDSISENSLFISIDGRLMINGADSEGHIVMATNGVTSEFKTYRCDFGHEFYYTYMFKYNDKLYAVAYQSSGSSWKYLRIYIVNVPYESTLFSFTEISFVSNNVRDIENRYICHTPNLINNCLFIMHYIDYSSAPPYKILNHCYIFNISMLLSDNSCFNKSVHINADNII